MTKTKSEELKPCIFDRKDALIVDRQAARACPHRRAPVPRARGNVVILGNVEISENGIPYTVERALLVQFPTVEAVKAAILTEECAFTILEGIA